MPSNRIIKFRAWDKDDKVYFLNALMVPEGLDGSHPFDGHVLLPINERYIFQQFTGLTDRNGIDIYEGDIVKEKEEGEVFVYDIKVIDDRYTTGWAIGYRNVVEVIGNIYENGDLLT